MYANIVNNIVIDVCAESPEQRYHPAIAADFVSVPNDVIVGMVQNEDGSFALPEVEVLPEANEQSETAVFSLSQDEFLFWLGAERRIEIRTLAKTDPAVEDFMDMLNRTNTLHADHPELIEALTYLETLENSKLTGILDDFHSLDQA